MPCEVSREDAPATLAQFAHWLKQRQDELWNLRERRIGNSGKIAIATGKRRDAAGPAIVEVNLHQASPEYLVLRDLLDYVDQLCPADVAHEFHGRWPREQFAVVRDLIHA